jgi:hypothetical protein
MFRAGFARISIPKSCNPSDVIIASLLSMPAPPGNWLLMCQFMRENPTAGPGDRVFGAE